MTVAAVVVVVMHQDLKAHQEALALACAPDAAGRHGGADEAAAVVHGGATLLPEVEDALPSREHGGEEQGGEEGGGRGRALTSPLLCELLSNVSYQLSV